MSRDRTIWRVLLLGPMELACDEGASTPRGARQRALVLALAEECGDWVSLERLTGRLWPHGAPDDPRHALQAQVSRLRARLGGCIEQRPGAYRFDPRRVRTDLQEFETLADQGRQRLASARPARAVLSLRAALALWRGDVAHTHVGGPDDAALHERLKDARLAAELDLLEALTLLGEDVAGRLREIAQTRSLEERPWMLLMQAHARAGREEAALAAFRRARQVFRAELGADPPPGLAALHQSLLAREPCVDRRRRLERTHEEPPAPLDSPVVFADTGSLVGREAERAVLSTAWDGARADVRVVSVSGDAGIGKTRLATDVLRRAAAEGAAVLSAVCRRETRQPFGSLAQLLRAGIRLDGASDLPTSLTAVLQGADDSLRAPEHDRPVISPPLESSISATTGALLDWLHSLGHRGRTLLLVDDAQWADLETLHVLSRLAEDPEPGSVMVLLTIRDGDVPDDEARRRELHRLRRQSHRSVHLALEPLPASDLRTIVEAELRMSASSSASAARATSSLDVAETEAAVDRVVAASEGNPLFAIELARHLAFSPGTSEAVPSGLRILVQQRLADLDPDVRDVVEALSVLGEAPAADLALVAGIDLETLDRRLAVALQARFLESAPMLRVRFHHELVATTVYDSLSPLRRADLHRRCVETLDDGRPLRGDRLGAVAHHVSLAAPLVGSETALPILVAAASDALDRLSPPAAARWAAKALEVVDGDPTTSGTGLHIDALIALGIAQFHLGDAAFRETLLAASREALAAGDVQRLTTAVIENSRGWWSSLDSLDRDRIQLLREALIRLPAEDLPRRAAVAAYLAVEQVRDQDARESCLELARWAAGAAEQTGDEQIIGLCLASLYTVTFALFADPHACLHISQRLESLAERLDDDFLRLRAAVGHVQAALMSGEYAVAAERRQVGLALARRLEQPIREWILEVYGVSLLSARGDHEGAERLAAEAYARGEELGQSDAATWFAGHFFAAAVARDGVAEIIDLVDEAASGDAALPVWSAGQAYACTRAGRSDHARRLLDQLVDLPSSAVALPRDMLWLHGATLLAETAIFLEADSEAALLFDLLRPYRGLMVHNGVVDLGPVDLYLARLARMLGRVEAGTFLRDAEALCEHPGMSLWAGKVADERGRLPLSAGS